MIFSCVVRVMIVSTTFLVVTFVEIGEIEASTAGHVKAAISSSDFLILAILTVYGTHAAAAATPGPRRLRIDFLMGPTARVRFWATRGTVTLGI